MSTQRRLEKYGGKKRGTYRNMMTQNTIGRNVMISDSMKQQMDPRLHIVRMFMELLTSVRIFHWSTKSFAQHKTTDNLYTKLDDNIDRFIETLSGKENPENRIHSNRVYNQMKLYVFDSNNGLMNALVEFRDCLISFCDIFDRKKDTDLLTIRDEMLADINQHLYLLTMQ